MDSNKIDVIFKRIAIEKIRGIVDRLKKKRGVLGYQDLLVKVRDGLEGSDSVCNKLLNLRYTSLQQHLCNIPFKILCGCFYLFNRIKGSSM